VAEEFGKIHDFSFVRVLCYLRIPCNYVGIAFADFVADNLIRGSYIPPRGVAFVAKRVIEEERDSGNIEHGLRLAKIRKTIGLNQAELGARIGVDQSVISRFEKGQRKMYDDILTELAQALNVTPNDILGISPCKPIKTDEASISRRLTQRMKQIEALPRRAQDKVIATLELALKGARN